MTKFDESAVILIIEDNEDHAELIMRCFEEHQITNKAFHVADGEKALDFVFGRGEYQDRTKYPVPNLILLDLRIPKLDGLEVLKQVKRDERTKYIPVVILTSSSNEKDLLSAYDSYVNSYLVKPLTYEKYLKLINDLGQYWLEINNQPVL